MSCHSGFYDIVRFPEYTTKTASNLPDARCGCPRVAWTQTRAERGRFAGQTRAEQTQDAGQTRVDAVPSYFLAVLYYTRVCIICESASCESASCESASCKSASCESASCESASCESENEYFNKQI